ncbi:hypothetical protein AB0J83_38165 [Actinoplanes sp. NPDC049596]|uniref:hypothetical protein n=1 Tax=unclassified Actinoplanes TaxID=2626549 RepID=UPI0034319830
MNQTRPATVRIAFYFQIAVVGMLVLFVGATIARAIHYDGLISEAALGTGADPGDVADERSTNISDTLFPAIPALILAVWLGITAFFVRRGNNTARILTLVGMGAPAVLFLFGCLLGGFGLFFVFGALFTSGFDEDEPYADEPFPDDSTDFSGGSFPGDAFYDKLADLDSTGWSVAFQVIDFATLLLALACAIVTAVLLLVGPSSRFFRPARPFQPPFGYPMPPAFPAPAAWHPYAPVPHPPMPFPPPPMPFPQPPAPFPQPSDPFAGTSPYAPPPTDWSGAAPASPPSDQPPASPPSDQPPFSAPSDQPSPPPASPPADPAGPPPSA